MMYDYKTASQQNFDRQADCYDQTSFGQHARSLYPVLLAQLAQIPRASILDVGCGTGELLRKISARWPDSRCAGVDLSPQMVAVAREKLGGAVSVLQGDSEALPLESGCFEAVLCCDSFHHYPHPDLALQEIFRVLKPGGVFLLADTTAPAPLRQLVNLLLPFGHGGDVRLYSPRELTKLLERSFQGVECRRVSPSGLLAWGIK